MRLKLTISMLSIAVFAVCSQAANATTAGAVYTLSNSSSGNAVLVYNRSATGQLTPGGSFSTGGMGSGAGLASQGALALDSSNRFLFVVNAGSNTVSVFEVMQNGLHLVGTTSSGGENPVSVTSFGRILYVLNEGGAVGGVDTIAGFEVNATGQLQMISHGIGLSAASVAPAQVSFNPEGNLLIVTEKNTNKIDIFSLNDAGVPMKRSIINSAGETPYGFAFGRRDQLFVSDAVGGAAGAGAMSSYFVSTDGTAHTLDGLANDNQSAPCWVALTGDGRLLYTINSASGTVSGYGISYIGQLQLLSPNGVAASLGTTSAPIDAAISNDSSFLYVLAPGTGMIDGFTVGVNGALTPDAQVSNIPASASGLAVR